MRTLVLSLLIAVCLVVTPSRADDWTTGTYQYDEAANVKSIGDEQLRYDTLQRLKAVSGSERAQSFTYDRYGNLLSETTGTQTIGFGVDPATNRLTDASKGRFATYDDAGRMTTELGGSGNALVYDALDVVTTSTVDGSVRVHLYTASDQRIATVTPAGDLTSAEWTLRDGAGKIIRRAVSRNGAWTWSQDYVYGGGGVLAAEVPRAEGTLHFFTDHLGSPRVITGNGGARVALHTYYAYGAESTDAAQDAERLKFTGHERDAASLDYMLARYYNPQWGRFSSPDLVPGTPGQPQSWNRYTYVMSSPAGFVDPNGLEPIPANLRKFYEALFGQSLASVEVYRMPMVGEGLTTGSNSVFLSMRGFGWFQNRNVAGVALLGHELSHVVDVRASGGYFNFMKAYVREVVTSTDDTPILETAMTEDRAYTVGANIRDFLMSSENADIRNALSADRPLSPQQLSRVAAFASTMYDGEVRVEMRYEMVDGQIVKRLELIRVK